MPAIYVQEQGAYIKKLDKRIAVEKNGKRLAEFQLDNISNISVIGNVQVTTQALHMLMENGIDVAFFTYSGAYIGQIEAESSKNIFLRFAQYEAYQDIEKRLEIARTIVKNKVNNQIELITSYDWDKNSEYNWKEDVKKMRELIKKLDKAETSNEIMGVEGICSSIYFRSFGAMFRCKIKFDGRNRRPPRDPINIILSLGYTLITKEVEAALESESFETYLGFLHGIRYGRKSLSLDIVEEFRQPIIDRLTITLFNKQMLSEFDFDSQGEQVILTEDGFKKYCKYYERFMKQPINANDPRSFRAAIRSQAINLKKAIQKGEMYIPYAWRYNDVSSLL